MNALWAIFEPLLLFVVKKFFDLIIYLVTQLILLLKHLFGLAIAKAQSQDNDYQETNLLSEEEKRQQRHIVFTNKLENEFGTLDISATGILRSATNTEINALADKHGGAASSLGASAADTLLNSGSDWKRGAVKGALKTGATCDISRSVSDLSEKEMMVLRTLSFMNSLMLVDDEHFGSICMTIIYNGGNCMLETNFMDKPHVHAAILELIKNKVPAAGIGTQRGVTTIGQVREFLAKDNPHALSEVDREMGRNVGWAKVESL